MATLYQLTDEYRNLVDNYDMAETDDEREEIIAALIKISGDIRVKSDGNARVMRNVSAEAKAFREESDRLAKCAKVREYLVERLKQAQLNAMLTTGLTKIETSIGTWRTQLNTMSCWVSNPDKVPQRFHVPQPDKIDKQAMIKEHKATGELFDGAEFKQEIGIRFR